MKDISYILDNFPIDNLVNLDEPIKNNDNIENDNYFKRLGIVTNVETNYKKALLGKLLLILSRQSILQD